MSDVINYPLSAAIKLCEQLDNDQTNYYLKMLEYKHERDEAREQIERQSDRIRYLEGATNHAEGTPLSIALRERDEARDAILGWENKWRCAVDMAARAELERDEAREKYNNLATENMLAVNKLCNERDEAKEEVRLLQAILDIIRKDSQ